MVKATNAAGVTAIGKVTVLISNPFQLIPSNLRLCVPATQILSVTVWSFMVSKAMTAIHLVCLSFTTTLSIFSNSAA